MRSAVIQVLFDLLLDLLYPKVCSHCGDPFKSGLSNILCRPCFDSQAPYAEPTCHHCGISLSAAAFEGIERPLCRDCGEGDHALDEVRAYGPYTGPLRIAHHAFKFEGMEGLAAPLADRWLEILPWRFWDGIEALVPVPLSWERQKQRGHNPAQRLAEHLAGKLRLPVLPVLKKVRSTKPQMSLEREERLKNPKGAYQVAPRMTLPRRLLLVDDVYTTGATLEECAKVLKKGGVSVVKAVVLGRTEHH